MHTDMELCETVRMTALAIHRYHRWGHLEKVYENALAHRLRRDGINVRQQCPLTALDEDRTVLGEYFADLLVDDRLIVDVTACKRIAEEHIARMLGYLRSSRMEHGLLVNFGAPEFEIRRLVLSDPCRERPCMARPLLASLVPLCGRFIFRRTTIQRR
jgi:GxxExxY protein